MRTFRFRTRLAIYFVVFCAIGFWGHRTMIRMPGQSHTGPLPELTAEQLELRDALHHHVQSLAGDIGERNVYVPEALDAAADYIEARFQEYGYEVERQGYEAGGTTCYNLIVELRGATHPDEIVVVGAHYDTVSGSPGANDNTSGVAAVLELAQRAADRSPSRTLRFIAFVNEEPPFFQTPRMGSLVYAQSIKERGDQVIAMISIETIGFYDDHPGTQRYPPPLNLFYPGEGNFVAIIGNTRSRALVRHATATFRKTTPFPSEGAALPSGVPGVGWSDHWSFWKQGWSAIMFTDTAPFRYGHYHTHNDTPDQLDYDRMTRVVTGIDHVIQDLTDAQ